LRQDKEESKEIEAPMGLSLLGAYEEDEDDEPEPSPPSNKVFFFLQEDSVQSSSTFFLIIYHNDIAFQHLYLSSLSVSVYERAHVFLGGGAEGGL